MTHSQFNDTFVRRATSNGGFAQGAAGAIVITTGSDAAHTPPMVEFHDQDDKLVAPQTLTQAEAGPLPTVDDTTHPDLDPANADNFDSQSATLPTGGVLVARRLLKHLEEQS